MESQMKHRVRLLLASTVIGSLIAVSARTTCHRIALYRPVYRVLNSERGVDNPWELIRRNYYLTDCQADRTCEILREHGEFHFRMFNFISRRLADDADRLWKYTCKAHE